MNKSDCLELTKKNIILKQCFPIKKKSAIFGGKKVPNLYFNQAVAFIVKLSKNIFKNDKTSSGSAFNKLQTIR